MPIDLKDFNQFFVDYQERLIHFATAYVRNEAVAEDCVIESMTSLWLKRDTLSEQQNLLSWVLTVIKNKCIDYLRKEQKNLHIDNSDSSWEMKERLAGLESFRPDEIFTQEIRDIIDRTLESLPSQTRQIFVLSVYENKKHSEIAQVMHLSVAGVEYHIYKAKDALRVALRDYLPAMALFVYLC